VKPEPVRDLARPERGAPVPFVDLKRQHAPLRDAIRERIDQVLESQHFILGHWLERFERAVAHRIGVAHAIGVGSGTDALILPLLALDLAPGDEILTVPFTFFATAGAIHHAGGRPAFVDIERDTFNMDVALVEAAITPRTRAIVTVHLFGQMAEMAPLREIADRRGLFLIEDAAQSIGSRQLVDGGWREAGAIGDVGAFSFFPSKNLGGIGDGGMIVTDDGRLADRLRRLRIHGATRRDHHEAIGTASRLDEVQAAVLDLKLEHLDGWNRARREHARWYDARLADLAAAGRVTRPVERQANEATYNQYTLRARDRDGLKAHLVERGVGCAVYYSEPLHVQPCFRFLGYGEGDFPESERAAAEAISLPIYPEITTQDLERVAAAIEEFYG
jgi:dTDP-4-amino-4,6-dideoxygalactose transaminase